MANANHMPNQIGITHKQNLEVDLVAGTSKVQKFDVDVIDSFLQLSFVTFACAAAQQLHSNASFILTLKGIPIMHMYARMCV